jgi:hypothetical protein
VGPLEVVDEAIAVELTGALLGECVEREPLEGQLALAIGAPDGAEVEVQVGGGGLRRVCRRVDGIPERGATVGAANLCLLHVGGVERLALGVGQDVGPVDVLDRHEAGAGAGVRGGCISVVIAVATTAGGEHEGRNADCEGSCH